MFQTISTFDRSFKTRYTILYQIDLPMQNKKSKRYGLGSLTEAIRQARLAKGWSQRDLSARAHLTQAQISRIENGEVDMQVSTLIELARSLDLASAGAENSACRRRGGDSFGRGTVGRAVGQRLSGRLAPPRRASREGRARAGGHRLDRVDPSRSRAARIGGSLALPRLRTH